jgi:hypothetical protein
MTKLSDMQLILLSTACQREDGSLLPPPDTLGGQTLRIRKAVTALIKAGLAIEVEATDEARSWRKANDTLFGVVISDAGRERIAPAVEEPQVEAAPPSSVSRPTSKIAGVIALMRRAEGASLTEMVEQTGWLPHTTRAALTGLRKKGHAIVRGDRGGVTVYRLAA